MAVFGELQRIAQQVHQNLLEAGGIAADASRDAGLQADVQAQLLFQRPGGEQANGLGNEDFVSKSMSSRLSLPEPMRA